MQLTGRQGRIIRAGVTDMPYQQKLCSVAHDPGAVLIKCLLSGHVAGMRGSWVSNLGGGGTTAFIDRSQIALRANLTRQRHRQFWHVSFMQYGPCRDHL